jgi:hypothetical protein
MRGADDRSAAAELAAALEGAAASDDVRALARLLEDAAGSVRFDVPPSEVETALTRVPRQRPRRLQIPVRAVAALAAVAAAVAVVAIPPLRGSPVDVEARAASAVGRLAVLHEVSQISSPGGVLPPGGLSSWIDRSGGGRRVALTRTDQSGRAVAEILSVPGRYLRYQPEEGSAVTGPSCRAVASGCAELLDPVELYRQALVRHGIERAEKVTADGRTAYRFTLPLPAGAGAVRQVVTVDGETFLPVTIDWRDRTGTVAVIHTEFVQQVAPGHVPAGTFDLALAPGTTVRQVLGDGTDVRVAGIRPTSLHALRASGLEAGWIGPRLHGRALTAVDLVRFSGGARAVRYRYGAATVWSYAEAVPPALRAGHLSPTKILTDADGRTVHFFETLSGIAAERDLAGVTVAVTAPRLAKIDVFAALQQARLLNPSA